MAVAKTARSTVKRASVHTVARRARVSVATVSRVINRQPDVDAALRERVISASREIGFIPKLQRRTIAVVIGGFRPFSAAGYVTAMLGALVKGLAHHDYLVEVVDMENLDPAREAHVDGVLGVVFDERITSLKKIPNLPILTINSPLLEHGIHSVATDHFGHAVIATEHLLANGHRRIAFLEAMSTNWASRQRLAGYTEALSRAGLKVDPGLVGYATHQPLYDVLGTFLRREATALLNFGDETGLETVHLLTDVMGRSIPKDISLISVEYGPPRFRYVTPPHTVISQPMEDAAQIAVDKMMEICKRPREKGGELIDVTLPCQLVEGKSVARISPA